jgi:cation:H+ antiporter
MMDYLSVLLGFIILLVSGDLIVRSGVSLARHLRISTLVVGVTVVSFGTSLPELLVSVGAAFKGHPDIAVGNVVGSNIFNILLVLGVSSVIRPLPFNLHNNLDIFVMLISNLFLFFSVFSGKKYIVDRWEGAVFFCCYAAYIGFQLFA